MPKPRELPLSFEIEVMKKCKSIGLDVLQVGRIVEDAFLHHKLFNQNLTAEEVTNEIDRKMILYSRVCAGEVEA